MRNWKIPAIVLVLLVLAMVFRWDNVASTTNNGVIIQTSKDRWIGAVWQTTIKNGSYNRSIITPSWIESMRTPDEKQVEVQEPVYTEVPSDKNNRYYYLFPTETKVTYVAKTKTIKVPPEPIYWLSSNGLTKVWFYLVGAIILWLLMGLYKNKKKTA
jgi:hypothetical protein